MELIHLQQRLGDLASAALGRKRERFGALAASLDAMSPLKVLTRGYAMATDGAGALLRSVDQAEVGGEIALRLADGRIAAKVTNIEREADYEPSK